MRVPTPAETGPRGVCREQPVCASSLCVPPLAGVWGLQALVQCLGSLGGSWGFELRSSGPRTGTAKIFTHWSCFPSNLFWREGFVAQAGHELVAIFLPQPPTSGDYRCDPPAW